ncbi:MAG: beta-ketoacyl-ACP synthase III [Bdellovibrionota bacterium]
MNYGARIVSTGLGIPSRKVTNDDMSKIVETSDEWITSRTGIKERKFVDSDNAEYITQLCTRAGQEALKNAGLKTTDIDAMISCTISAETVMPNNSARVMGALGMKATPSFDISAACGGFVFGLHTARALIQNGSHKRIMLFGADVLSAALNMKDRSTCVLFGDGAGCAILERVENPKPETDSMILGSKIYTDFDAAGSLTINAGGSRAPSWKTESHVENSPYIQMSGQDVFKHAVKGMVHAATELLTELKVPTSAIKWFVPHQANLRIIEMTAKYLDFPMDRVFVNIDTWANTSAATVAIALAEMEQQKKLQRGDLILLDVFGGGFNYGAALVRW